MSLDTSEYLIYLVCLDCRKGYDRFVDRAGQVNGWYKFICQHCKRETKQFCYGVHMCPGTLERKLSAEFDKRMNQATEMLVK